MAVNVLKEACIVHPIETSLYDIQEVLYLSHSQGRVWQDPRLFTDAILHCIQGKFKSYFN